MTTLYVDNIAPNLQSRVSVPGHVIQVVQTFKDDTYVTTSTSRVDVTGLSATITPTSSSSKILVQLDMGSFAMSTYAYLYLMRDSTDICVGATASGLVSCTMAGYVGSSSESTTYYGARRDSAQYLDSPNTTSAVTYKVQVNNGTTGTILINRNNQDSGGYGMRVPSSITLMEIAG